MTEAVEQDYEGVSVRVVRPESLIALYLNRPLVDESADRFIRKELSPTRRSPRGTPPFQVDGPTRARRPER